jgi:hypothetical protein
VIKPAGHLARLMALPSAELHLVMKFMLQRGKEDARLVA